MNLVSTGYFELHVLRVEVFLSLERRGKGDLAGGGHRYSEYYPMKGCPT
jgi:hypothetical protein